MYNSKDHHEGRLPGAERAEPVPAARRRPPHQAHPDEYEYEYEYDYECSISLV